MQKLISKEEEAVPKNKHGNFKEKKRIIYFDILNILACICVIFLHMNGIVHNYSNSRSWKTALIFEVICYWAVPVFIMLSGATLFKYKERYDTKTFFKKRFIKVLIPWVIWSFILYIANNKKLDIIQFIKDFVYCRIEGIYWFFPLILYLYCLIPIFSIFTEKVEYRKILKGIFVFIFIFRAIIYPMCIIFDKSFPSIFGYCLEQNGYIMFLILGYLISTTNLTKKKRMLIYCLGVIAAITRYLYTYCFSIRDEIVNRDLFDYCSAVSVLLAISVFVFIKNINWEKMINKFKITPKILSEISACSFGVYLIHMLVKNHVTDILKLNVFSIWYRTIGAVGLYIICLMIVYIIKKIPIVKKIVP